MNYPSIWLQGASRGEAIACELRLHIIKGQLLPGEVVSENRVAADFGTSRSPVREALRALAGEGLIRLERMGAIVLGLSAQDRAELYDVRYLIESFVQQRIAESCPPGLLAQQQQRMDRMALAVQHRDAGEFAYLDFRFHETLVESADHARILHLWNSIRQLVMAVMLVTTESLFAYGEERMEQVMEKHRQLLRGLASGDKEQAARMVERYFADSQRTLQATLDEINAPDRMG